MTQWEKYHCKASYSERRKNRPTGSVLTASKTSPPVLLTSREPGPLHPPPPPPPPPEGRGVAGEALGVSRASSCTRSRGEKGVGRGGGCGVVAGSRAVSVYSSLTGGRGGEGGISCNSSFPAFNCAHSISSLAWFV